MTAPLDEKGLEAAREAVGTIPGAALWAEVEKAIRAYLAASPSPSEMDVVAWLVSTQDVEPFAVTSEKTAQYGTVQGWDVSPLVTLSQAQSALAAMRAERDEAIRRGEDQWAGWVKEEVRRKEAETQVLRLTEENEALRKERTSLIKTKREQIERMQRRLDLHEAAISFVRRWAVEKEGNGTSAEERLSAIAHHPALKENAL